MLHEVRLLPIDDAARQGLVIGLLARTGVETGLDPCSFGETNYWLIEARDGDSSRRIVCGYTGIHSVNWLSRLYRGVAWVTPEYRRQGIGEAALLIRNDIVFDQYGMNGVGWATSVQNTPAKALSLKIGGKPGKIVSDYETYGMSRQEWKSLRRVEV